MADDPNKTYHVYGSDATDIVSAESTSDAKVKVTSNPNRSPMSSPSGRRMRRTSFQARLGKKLDRISVKILDNDIRLTSNPTDMLRIEVTRDERSSDLKRRTVKSVEVLPIILPVLKDIPLRHMLREETDILIPSMYMIANEEYFEIWAPIEVDLNEDDLLIRILNDSSPEINDPYVMVLQVKEVLGTFGYASLVWKKCLCTFYDEALPSQIINVIKENIKKRELLGW